MPKLSARSLEKRFPCPHCNHTFRTRQGLSGHIQFKHRFGSVQGVVSPYLPGPQKAGFSVDDIHSMVMKWIKIGKNIESSPAEIESQKRILRAWPETDVLCKALGVRLTDSDFKNYLVTSLGCSFVIASLREEMIRELRRLQKSGQ